MKSGAMLCTAVISVSRGSAKHAESLDTALHSRALSVRKIVSIISCADDGLQCILVIVCLLSLPRLMPLPLLLLLVVVAAAVVDTFGIRIGGLLRLGRGGSGTTS
jgi:hypothetical protein